MSDEIKALARLMFERDGATLAAISDKTGLTTQALADLTTEEMWIPASEPVSDLPANRAKERRSRIQDKAEREVELEVARRLSSEYSSLHEMLQEDAVIEANAIETSRVMTLHRNGATRIRELVSRLCQELQVACLSDEDLSAIIEAIGIEDGQEGDSAAAQARITQRSMQAFRKLLSLDSRADTAKKLVDSLVKVIDLERRVYGIKDETSEGDIARALKELAENG